MLVDRLLAAGHEVRVVVRSVEKLSKTAREHPNLSVTLASLLDLSEDELDDLVAGCGAIGSCLGDKKRDKKRG